MSSVHDFYIVMGVSGSGKTTVGQQLAAQLNRPFFDADDFHPQSNIDKMSAGQPLDDSDRFPWLLRLATLIGAQQKINRPSVLACSALKARYRDILTAAANRVRFIYLAGEFDLIKRRLTERDNHFMAADMLRSQFASLEVPTPAEALHVAIDGTTDEIVATIIASLENADDFA